RAISSATIGSHTAIPAIGVSSQGHARLVVNAVRKSFALCALSGACAGIGGDAVAMPSASTPVATITVGNAVRQRRGSFITLNSVMPMMTPTVTGPAATVNKAHVAHIQPAIHGAVPAG